MGASQSKPRPGRRRLLKRKTDDGSTAAPLAGKELQASSLPPSYDQSQQLQKQQQQQSPSASQWQQQQQQQQQQPQKARPAIGASASSPPSTDPATKPISALEAHNARHRETRGTVDTQTGERQEFTDIWHSLAHKISDDSLDGIKEADEDGPRASGEQIVASLSREVWQHIASFLAPNDAASLAIATRTLFDRLGDAPLRALWKPHNFEARIEFLLNLDAGLPDHLLCFNCGTYHLRTHPGLERLQANSVLNPLVQCPKATDPTVVVPRARLVPSYSLPFAFAQLAIRAHKYGPEYGIEASSLGRRWTDKASGWTHATSFHVNPKTGHLLMRSTSNVRAEPDLPPAGMRHLIFDKADYTPHYSVCAHWRDGELVPLTKCALDHVPGTGPGLVHRVADRARGEMMQGIVGRPAKPNNNIMIGGGTGPAGQCAQCRPTRRCPECPTEYLIELRLMEEKKRRPDDPDSPTSPTSPTSPSGRRKNSAASAIPNMVPCISVTRWSDLGDGRLPFKDEWAACTGVEGAERFDSFRRVGGRTVSGTFEARFGDSMAGQRVLDLNPKRERKGEKGHRWY